MPVTWSDALDDVLASDLTAVLSYATPAGGAVITPVAPIGLRDREAGTVGFTTSVGFGRKLERIRRDPRVALTYHAREHGFSRSGMFVHVQGTATPRRLDLEALQREVGSRSERFMGPPRTGRFWDRWLREYYQDRLVVDVAVTRIITWPDLGCGGEPEVTGEPLPVAPPAPQTPPAKGTEPRSRWRWARGARTASGSPPRAPRCRRAAAVPAWWGTATAPGWWGSRCASTPAG